MSPVQCHSYRVMGARLAIKDTLTIYLLRRKIAWCHPINYVRPQRRRDRKRFVAISPSSATKGVATCQAGYGPVLGKTATPRVQDLVVERRAVKWLYFLAVWSATAALLLHQPPAFRVAASSMAIAAAGIIVQLVRAARRLSDVQSAFRLPDDVRTPRLLLFWIQQT